MPTRTTDWGPRDAEGAARTLGSAVGLGALGGLIEAVLLQRAVLPAIIVAAAVAAIGSQAPRLVGVVAPWTWAVVAVCGPPAAATLVLTGVWSAFAGSGMILYWLIYAASQFRARVAWSVVVVAVIAMGALSAAGVGAVPAEAYSVFAGSAVFFVPMLLKQGARQDQLVAQLIRTADEDALTRLGTRRALERRAEAAGDVPAGLVVLDVDDFKRVNDSFGHPAGDQVLAILAGIIRDVACPTDFAARLGGDEFSLLVEGDPRAVAASAEGILARVRASPELRGTGTTVSIGVAVGKAADLPALYGAADVALYSSKASGGGTISWAAIERGSAGSTTRGV